MERTVHIRIKWMSQTHDCDTCGYNWADGARVYFNDKIALDLEPVAGCFDGISYSTEEVFIRTLEKLGYVVEIDHD